MAGLQTIIDTRINRLESIPDEFVNRVIASDKKMLAEITSLIANLDRNKEGAIILNTRNQSLINQISDNLNQLYFDTGYQQTLIDFVSEFDKQAIVSQEYFAEVTKTAFNDKALYKNILEQGQERALTLLGEAAIDVNVSQPLTDILRNAVNQQSSFEDLVDSITTQILGEPDIDGQMVRHSKTWARDSLTNSDREYNNIVGEDLGLVFVQYTGGLVRDSRDFCKARTGQYYHIKEVELWTTTSGPEGANPFPHGSQWQGRKRGTTPVNISVFLGGWNCLHSLLYYPTSEVPASVVERAKSQGFKV